MPIDGETSDPWKANQKAGSRVSTPLNPAYARYSSFRHVWYTFTRVRREGGRMKKNSRLANVRPDQPSPYSGDLIFARF